MTTAEPQTRHETSLAVWDIPTAAAGERFRVKIGAKSAAGCTLAGCRIELRRGEKVVAEGRLGGEPWPGTAALYWAELEMPAPDMPGAIELVARLDPDPSDEPHDGASAAFRVSVAGTPEHVLTVKVVSGGAPVEEAYVRLGPYRGVTDAAGMAAVKLAKGRYELVVWKAGTEIAPRPLSIEADTAVEVEAVALPEPDPDSIWTA